MWKFGFLPVILMLGLLACVEAQASDIPKLPSRDEFYQYDGPRDWTNKDLGKILRSRRVTIDLSAIPGGATEYGAFQLLYVTSDLYKEFNTSVTTIIVPEGANTSRILSYQIAYDSPDVNCSPSYGLQTGANKASLNFTRDQMNYIADILVDDDPPVLNIPDYEGANAAFTVGPQSAYQTLDSIRAATSSGESTGISKDAETVLFGYSGGGYASEWAVEFHHEYAQDVNIIGAALGAPPTNILQTYRNMNMRFSPLNAWAMLGVMNAFPYMKEWMENDLINEQRKRQFLGPLERCSEPANPPDPIPLVANLNKWFKSGNEFLTRFEAELTSIGVLGNKISPETAPHFPLYIFQGELDLVTFPLTDTLTLKQKYCQAGTPVYMALWPGNHLQTVGWGSPWAMKWVQKVFNREEIKNNCFGSYEVMEAVDF